MADNISVHETRQDGRVILAQVDVANPAGPVVIELDRKRKVLYVHIEGWTALRVCRVEKFVIEDNR